MNFVPPLGANKSLRLDQVVKRLRLTSGCKLILDAADVRSYGGSGQTWSDRSGGGYNFYLGATSGSEASDPTFTGAAGTLGAYFAHDGGDYCTLASANPSWVDNIHKNNAKLTLAAWVYLGATQAQVFSGSFDNTAANTGFTWGVQAANRMNFNVGNGSGSFAFTSTDDVGNALATGVWHFLAASIDEAAATGFLYTNGTVKTLTPTYTSPSSGAATSTMQIAARAGGAAPLSNGSRTGGVMMWESVALTAAQLDAIRQATRRRYGV